MGPTWVLLDPDGPHVGPVNLTIRANVWFDIITLILVLKPYMFNSRLESLRINLSKACFSIKMPCYKYRTWWPHDMDTLSAFLALCIGNPPVTGGFPTQRASNAALWWLSKSDITLMMYHFGDKMAMKYVISAIQSIISWTYYLHKDLSCTALYGNRPQ